MRILLDDRETPLRADTVAGALREAATLAERSGRMIVEVEVDGIVWTEEDLASAEHTARGAGEVRLSTTHPSQLLRETFLHATEAILNAEEIQRNAARLIQANRQGEGLNTLLEALATWGSVQTAVSRGLELGLVSRDDLKTNGVDLDGAVGALDAQLRSLRDAMRSQDPTAISDCLLYEFPPVARRFAETLASIASLLANMGGEESDSGPAARNK